MDKPKCKLCGERHWSGEACKFAARVGPESYPHPFPPSVFVDGEIFMALAIQEVEPPKFDKVAYQREYMRKRRAAAKARGGDV